MAYLIFHAFSGELGLFALMHMNRELEEKRLELAKLRERKDRLRLRVHHMQSESLDLDLLEEQARKTLGYAKPGEYVVIVDDPL
ncbi:MAG: septum formation initiator family protein [Rickettsiales bacterium]